MALLGSGVLTWITFLPIAGMIIILLVPKENKNVIRWTAAIATGLQLVLSIFLYMNFNRGMAGINTQEGFQFIEKFTWIDIKSVAWFGPVRIDFFMGIE